MDSDRPQFPKRQSAQFAMESSSQQLIDPESAQLVLESSFDPLLDLPLDMFDMPSSSQPLHFPELATPFVPSPHQSLPHPQSGQFIVSSSQQSFADSQSALPIIPSSSQPLLNPGSAQFAYPSPDGQFEFLGHQLAQPVIPSSSQPFFGTQSHQFAMPLAHQPVPYHQPAPYVFPSSQQQQPFSDAGQCVDLFSPTNTMMGIPNTNLGLAYTPVLPRLADVINPVIIGTCGHVQHLLARLHQLALKNIFLAAEGRNVQQGDISFFIIGTPTAGSRNVLETAYVLDMQRLGKEIFSYECQWKKAVTGAPKKNQQYGDLYKKGTIGDILRSREFTKFVWDAGRICRGLFLGFDIKIHDRSVNDIKILENRSRWLPGQEADLNLIGLKQCFAAERMHLAIAAPDVDLRVLRRAIKHKERLDSSGGDDEVSSIMKPSWSYKEVDILEARGLPSIIPDDTIDACCATVFLLPRLIPILYDRVKPHAPGGLVHNGVSRKSAVKWCPLELKAMSSMRVQQAYLKPAKFSETNAEQLPHNWGRCVCGKCKPRKDHSKPVALKRARSSEPSDAASPSDRAKRRKIQQAMEQEMQLQARQQAEKQAEGQEQPQAQQQAEQQAERQEQPQAQQQPTQRQVQQQVQSQKQKQKQKRLEDMTDDEFWSSFEDPDDP